MPFCSWCSRRVGGLSLIAVLFLCYWVLSSEIKTPEDYGRHSGKLSGHSYRNGDGTPRAVGTLTALFAYYSLLIHILVVVFPIRACYAIWDISRSLRRMGRVKKWKEIESLRLSSYSLLSAETLTPSHPYLSSSEAGDFDSGYLADSEVEQNNDIHAILIPNYKEDIQVLRETLDVLACHPQARSQYDIYLAMEAREPACDIKAMHLISDFVKKFRSIDFTLHPGDIANEAPGKSSNISWAARRASERYRVKKREDVIITVIDADSHLSSKYFELITTMRLEYPNTAPTTLYSAPIIFDRNAHLVPAIVRVADILWCAAGISGLYKSSTIRPPTSVYSLPLGLADIVGGWDTDGGAIGEDLHMFLKCFFALNGNLTPRTVLAPVSQTNVCSGLKGYSWRIQDCRARYRQALRHMWGALDSGFALRRLVELWRERKSTGRNFRPLHANGTHEKLYIPEAEFESLLKQKPIENGLYSDVMHHKVDPPNWTVILYLFHRLFEAHFLPVHMAILTIVSSIHVVVTANQPDRLHLSWTFQTTGYLRVIGFLLVGVYMGLYEKFHHICVSARKAEMDATDLHTEVQPQFSTRSMRTNFVDYFLIPIVAPLFGSIPASQAQICHFWTQDLVYAVSMKPTSQSAVEEERAEV